MFGGWRDGFVRQPGGVGKGGVKPASGGGDSHDERASFVVIKATKPGLRRHLAAILTMRGARQMRCPCRMAWRMSCLRDVHPIGDTLGEIAYHASISVAFIVETIKIARRVAAQPARRCQVGVLLPGVAACSA